ncbi:MAG: Rieske (2Fe-2S) protein [Pseudomonadota bacterium]
MPLFKLCSIDELNEIDSRGFLISDVSPERNIFIVKNKHQIYGYENMCPHNFSPLDWSPNQFLNFDNSYIQCANHGALFEINSGDCIYGPCAGQSLQSIKIEVKNKVIFAFI